MKSSTLKTLCRAGLCFAAVALALGAFPEWALGAEAGEVHHKEFSIVEEGFKFLNTLIVVLILYKLLAKPLALGRSFMGAILLTNLAYLALGEAASSLIGDHWQEEHVDIVLRGVLSRGVEPNAAS